MFITHPAGRFITSLTICLLGAYADLYLFLASLDSWYGSLQLPSLIPSVTILYYGIIGIAVLMGCGLYLIWNDALRSKDARLATWLVLFALVLNVSWFFVFFWAHSIFFGMVVLLILISVMAAVLYQSLRSAVLAILFLFPYFIVTIFTMYFNVLIYLMNPHHPLIGILG
jgi:tryptophan-rich sensory protein